MESKFKEKDERPSVASSSSSYARARASSLAKGDDDMPGNLDDALAFEQDEDILTSKREYADEQQPDLDALRKEVAQVVAQSIQEKKAAAQKQELTAEQQLREKLDSWKAAEATKDMDADFQTMQDQAQVPENTLSNDVQNAADKVRAMLLGGNGADLTPAAASSVVTPPTTTTAAAAVAQQQQQQQQFLVGPATTTTQVIQPVQVSAEAEVVVPASIAADAAEKQPKKEKKPKKLSDMDIIMGGLAADDDADDDDKQAKKSSKKSNAQSKKSATKTDPWGVEIKTPKQKDSASAAAAAAAASKDDSVLDIGSEDDVDSLLAKYEAAR